jgi:hypothetical protein
MMLGQVKSSIIIIIMGDGVAVNHRMYVHRRTIMVVVIGGSVGLMRNKPLGTISRTRGQIGATSKAVGTGGLTPSQVTT